ncbi:hypothetical protein [Streptomyces collinus]|uniref:hypothetical protein n=1 Tax=Streptomyces collinus TaxID=42684 RepID=UPI0037FB630C
MPDKNLQKKTWSGSLPGVTRQGQLGEVAMTLRRFVAALQGAQRLEDDLGRLRPVLQRRLVDAAVPKAARRRPRDECGRRRSDVEARKAKELGSGKE